MVTTTVQSRAVIDRRLDGLTEPDSTRYGFVWFEDEHVRVGYTTGLGEGTAELWQANWDTAWPSHFQAAANVLMEAGILVPRAGKVRVQTLTWDAPRLVRADAIDRDVVVKWSGHGAKREGQFVYVGR
jgi:hypothetical protein